MNRNFKVVFNKARGALMAVNECTSLVQAKGTKTVVAAALAVLAAGSAAADDVTLNTKTLDSWSNVKYEVTNKNQDYFGGNHSYGDQHVVAKGIEFSGNQLLALEKKLGSGNAADAQGGVMYLYSSGTTAKHENTRYTFDNVVFKNNAVLTESNQGNRPAAYGGALMIKGGETTFKNTVFTGNMATAAGTDANDSDKKAAGGGSAAGGAVFVDSTRNTHNYKATVNFEVTEDGLVNSGNTVKSGLEKPFTDGYTTKIPTAGGFLFMDRDVTTNFQIADGVTYTIGTEGAWKNDKNMDSIASSVYLDNVNHEGVVINKTGGGTLLMHGSLNDYYGTVNVNAGTLAVTSDWAAANTVTVNDGGTLKVKDLSFTDVKTASGYNGQAGWKGGGNKTEDIDVTPDKGSLVVNAGGTAVIDSLDATKGTVTVKGLLEVATLKTAAKGSLSLEGGTIKTAVGQLYTEGDKAATLDSETFKLRDGITLTSGEVAVTDEGTYDAAILESLKKTFVDAADVKSVTFVNAEFKATDGKLPELTDGLVIATGEAQLTAIPANGEASVATKNSGAATLKVVPTDGADVTVLNVTSAAESLTLTGTAAPQQLVVNKKGDALKVIVADKAELKLGSTKLDAETAGSLKHVTAQSGSTVSVANIDATIANLEAQGTSLINVGTGANRGSLTIENLSLASGSTIFVDPEWTNDPAKDVVRNASHVSVAKADLLAGSIVAARNSVVSYGASNDAADGLIERFKTLSWGPQGVTAAFVVADQLDLAQGGSIVVNGALANNTNVGDTATVSVARQGLLVVDQAAAQKAEGAFIKGTVLFEKDSTLGIVNAAPGEWRLADSTTDKGAGVLTDNPFITGSVKDGVVTTGFDSVSGLRAIASTGIQAMARRADQTFADTIADHAAGTAAVSQGAALWAQVSGEHYEADDFAHGADFDADMGYGAFGFEAAPAQGYTVGAAFQYGSGSLDSSVASIKNDVTSYGFALYGAANVGAGRVVADVSYLKTENELSSSQSLLNQTVDADVWSVGVRGEHAFKTGAVTVTPSVGVRVSRIKTDAMPFGTFTVEEQTQTIVQVPIALSVTAAETTVGAWSVAPSFKAAYVPTFGDKEIEAMGDEVDVIDASPVQATVGLSARTGAFTLSADLTGGLGEHGTKSYGGRIGVKYAF